MRLRYVLCVVLLLAAAKTSPAAEVLPAASQWIPAEAVAEVEISRPSAVFDLALDPDLLKSIGELPAWQKAAAEPKFQQFLAVVRFLEIQLNTDWAGGVRKLTGGGITAAIGPKGEAIFCIDAEDAAMLEKLHQIVLGFAASEAAKTNSPSPIASSEYRGVKVWTNADGAAHALIANRLILANRLDALKAVLDLRAGVGRSITTVPAYQAAKKAADPAAAAVAYVDMAAVLHNPKVQESLKNDNPLGAMLLLGLTDSLRDSKWLSLGLTAEKNVLRLRATVDGKTTAHDGIASFAWPQTSADGALPNLRVPRRIAAGSLHRDLHAFYAAKDKLFPERTSGLIFFENMMGIFFTGRDLTEEVLAQLQPDVRFVVAEQSYDPAIGTPKVQLPGFAVVFRLRHAEQAGEMFEEAWQKAIGLANFTRGQKAEPGLILDRDTYAGVRYTLGRFSAKGEKSKTDLPTRFNTQPAIARMGDDLVLSSTEQLTRDVLDALQHESAGSLQPAAGVSSVIELDGAQLSSILQANYKVMVNQNMIEKGSTQEQAEAQIGLLTIIPKYLDHAKLSLASEESRPVLTLDVTVNPTGHAAEQAGAK